MSDTDRLKELCGDWEDYNTLLSDNVEERRNMQRALLMEMRREMGRLEAFMRMDRPSQPGHRRKHGNA